MLRELLMSALIALGLAESPPAIIDEPDLAIERFELDPAALDRVTARILQRIYEAFSGESEEDVYDGLALVSAGDLLTDLYLQQRKASVYGVMSGVASEIVEVELFESRAVRGGEGYLIDAGWRVLGRLEHESHAHERVNLYSARLSIEPIAGQWRLTGFDLDQVERLNLDEFVGGE